MRVRRWKHMKKKTIIIIAVLVVIAVGAILINNQVQANKTASSQYQTETLKEGTLTAVVGATGTVRSQQSAVLSWKTSGQINNLAARVNEKVSSGQELAALAEGSLPQSVILAQADLVTAKRNLTNLEKSNTALAQAQLDLTNAQKNYNIVSGNQLYANTARYSNQDLIDSSRAAVTIAQDKVDKAQKYYDRFSETPDSDPTKAAALSSLANARQSLDQAKKNLNYYLNVPSTIDVTESDAKVALAKAQLEDAQREYDRLKNGPDPEDIAAAEARVAALQATIDTSTLRAPFAGTITESYSLVGDVVNAGTASFRIDDLSHLLVDVQLSEADVNRVKAGQTVDLTFDAIADKTYEGKVKSVSGVGTATAGGVNFVATVEILNPDPQVLPGMSAASNVIVEQITNALLVPNRAVRLHNEQYIVYILKNNAPVAVPIVMGSSSGSYTEILSGDVKAGDKVVLNPPSSILPGGGSASILGQ